MIWTPENSQAIGWISSDDKINAGAVYQDFNGRSVWAHIAIDGAIAPLFISAIFDYPFRQLKAEQILCSIMDTNKKSLHLARHMGFKPVSFIPDVYPGSSIFVVALKRDDCRYLRADYGKKRKNARGS